VHQETSVILSNREILPGIFKLTINYGGPLEDCRPGQFFMIKVGQGQAHLLRRPISLHQAADGQLHFLFAVVGEGTRWLAGRKPGEDLDILGPAGNGFSLTAGERNLLLVAGGMGIAPCYFLADQALWQGCRVKLLAGARSDEQLLPADYFPAGVEYLVATEDGSRGEKGLVTGLLSRHSAWADHIFICGPLPMFKAIAKNAATLLAGKPTDVSLEVRMGCGMGLCYSCTVKTARGLEKVCQDGPVFNIRDVDWAWLK